MRKILVLAAILALPGLLPGAAASHEPQCPADTETVGGGTRSALQVDTPVATFYRWMSGADNVVSRETNGVPGLQDTDRWCVASDRTLTVLYHADERVATVRLPCVGIVICIL